MMFIILINIILTSIASLLLGNLICYKWSSLKKIIYGYLLFFSINIFIGYLLAILKIPISGLVPSAILFAACLSLFYYEHKRGNLSQLFSWERTDFAIIIITVVSIAAFLIPTYKMGGGIRSLSFPLGEDMVTHFSLANAIGDNNGYLYGSKNYKERIATGLENYPQAVHYNFSFLANGTSTFENRNLLKMYEYYFLFNFILLLIVLCQSVFELALSANKSILLRLVAAFLMFLIMNNTVFVNTYKYGFISSAVCLAILVALVNMLVNKKLFRHDWLWLGVIILLNGAVAGSWYFMSPLALALSPYFIYKHTKLRYWISYILIFLIAVPPIYFSLNSGAAAGVNNAGAIERIPLHYILLLLGGALLAVYNYGQLNKALLRGYVVALIFALSFSAAILIFQQATTGGISYYFIKSGDIIIILLAILSVSGILAIIEKAKLRFGTFAEGNYYIFIALIVLFFGLLFSISGNLKNVSYGLLNERIYYFPSQIDNVIVSSRENRERNMTLNTGGYIFNGDSSIYQEDYTLSKLSSAYNLNLSVEYRQRLLNIFNKKP